MTRSHDALLPALLAARRDHRALPPADWPAPPVSEAEQAFALQLAQGQALGEWQPGEMPRHWKSGPGGAALTMVHAPLLPSGVWAHPADARAHGFFVPHIEAELALRLGREVSPDLAATLDEASAATCVDAICVSLEVVDSRWSELSAASAWQKLADFQVHGALVLGDWRPWQDRDWATQRGQMQIGEHAPIDFVGGHPMGRPQAVLPGWLRHLTRHGQRVPAGTVVTTGAWCGCLPVGPRGVTVRVAFEGLGEVSIRL